MSFSGKPGGVRGRLRLGIVDGDLLNFVVEDVIDLGDACGGAAAAPFSGVTAAGGTGGVGGGSGGGSVRELRWFGIEEAR